MNKLSKIEINKLLNNIEIIKKSEGDMIIRQNESNECIYILIEGTV